MSENSYRYFLGVQADSGLLREVDRVAAALELSVLPKMRDKLHMTMCVIAETPVPSRDIASLIDPIIGSTRLESCRIKLGRGESGKAGAMIRSLGSQRDVRSLYDKLIALLAPVGIEPLYRKAGLHAHITLSHHPLPDKRVRMPFDWRMSELHLVESHIGHAKHRRLASWPLHPPVQGELDLF